jgi:P-type E1-E2 ATPase
VTEYARVRGAEPSNDVTNLRVVSGRGVIGSCGTAGAAVLLGSERFLQEQHVELGASLRAAVQDALARELPLSLVAWDGHARGLFVCDERWRPFAADVLRWLTRGGLDVSVLTGDHAARGRSIARDLGVRVESELLPDQKVAAVEAARRAIGPVCMVGDGINDAPALAASDIGIALGCGTDLSRDSASICLLGDDLSRIPWAFELARRTRRVIRWNLLWAFGYNGIGVLCAALGWLNPALAAFLMVASGSLVTAGSLSLNRPFEISLQDGPPRPVLRQRAPIEHALQSRADPAVLWEASVP